jgi:hypothetical protein
MDVTTKETLDFIINLLIDDIDMAKSELKRLTFENEVANPPCDPSMPDGANDNLDTARVSESQFGTVNLPLQYTLGRGIPEALGDHLEEVVFTAFRKVAGVTDIRGLGTTEMNFRRTGMLVSRYWDKENKCVCLHLELVHTEDSIDMEFFDEEIGVPQGRPLN